MGLLVSALLSTLVAGIVAAPANELVDRSTCYTDTYEEYGAVTDPGRAAIGQYHSVTYQAFVAATKGTISGNIGGVKPHSGNNAAVASMVNALVQIGAVTMNPFGNIIASPSQSFDLYSFWFGCGQNNVNPQIPGIPEGCSISVTGYNTANQVVPIASFNYAPTSSTVATMQLATLPATFRNLRKVTLGVTTASLATAGALLIIDDLIHCN